MVDLLDKAYHMLNICNYRYANCYDMCSLCDHSMYNEKYTTTSKKTVGNK
jgi:hypothetical protein